MEFSKLEKIMATQGISSLAEIARRLDSTPQAVSNWKSRDQVPHHILTKLNLMSNTDNSGSTVVTSQALKSGDDTVSLSDILLTLAEQLKVIILIPFITIFLTVTYIQFIQQPQYVSWVTVLLPSSSTGNLGGLGALASQFGVNVPSASQADLSSPSLFPELMKSRTFAEKILDKEFYLDKYGKKLSLLAILTHGDQPPQVEKETLVTQALGSLGKILEFDQDPSSSFSIIRVTTSEPLFAKELAEAVLVQLEDLNRFYKVQTINEKTLFISNRISSVKNDLEASEKALKEFSERNRQISSPALQLEQGRLARDVEIQKGIYLTLKQQYELAKIEEVQEASIVQVLDRPQISLNPSNKNLRLGILMAGFLGVGIGVFLGFIRSYLDNNDMSERKKLRRIKHFLKKKTKDIILDRRVSGIISLLLILGLPFYLGYESKIPVFFGMYSAKLMIINTIYVFMLISSCTLFLFLTKKSKQ
jgi:uncharacterized protein involved in exopolysaccharide biosynthesis